MTDIHDYHYRTLADAEVEADRLTADPEHDIIFVVVRYAGERFAGDRFSVVMKLTALVNGFEILYEGSEE